MASSVEEAATAGGGVAVASTGADVDSVLVLATASGTATGESLADDAAGASATDGSGVTTSGSTTSACFTSGHVTERTNAHALPASGPRGARIGWMMATLSPLSGCGCCSVTHAQHERDGK